MEGVELLKGLLSGSKGDEDLCPIHKEDAPVGSRKHLHGTKLLSYLLGRVVLVQVRQLFLVGYCRVN